MPRYLSNEADNLAQELLEFPAGERTDYASVLTWSTQAGLITVMEACELSRQAQADPYTAADEVDRLDDLIETARIVNAERDTAAADRLAKAYHQAMAHATLVPQGEHWVRQDNSLDLAMIRRRAVRALMMRFMGAYQPAPAS